MVDDPALGVEAAHPGARVYAVLVDAGQRTRAVAVHHALRPAARVRVTEVLRSAATDAGAAADPGIGIGSTRIRIAGISWRWRCCKEKSKLKSKNWLSLIRDKTQNHFIKNKLFEIYSGE